jgi:hypothetical protein
MTLIEKTKKLQWMRANGFKGSATWSLWCEIETERAQLKSEA